jgi:hypothetical protein
MNIRTTTLSVLSAAALCAPTAASAGTPNPDAIEGHTQVVANCTTYKQVPRKVVGACGDLNTVAIVRDWTTWTGHQARGKGTLVVNDCTPDCASGTFHRYPATFGLRKVVTTADGTRVFSRLGVTYVMGGEPRNTTIALPTTPLK